MARLVSRIGLVSAFTLVSRVLGLLRDMITSAMLGATIWNSAFITAFTLPNLFRRLLGEGALTAALMPNLSEELESRGRAAVHELVNKTLTWLLLTCLGITVVTLLALEGLKHLAVSEKWVLAAALGQIVFPYVVLICIAAILAAALNLFSRFGVPALTAVWLNLSIVAALGYSGWYLGGDLEQKTYWLCGGALFGGLLQMIVPAFALAKEGWRPRLDFAISPRVREVALLTLPGIFGAAVFQINIMVSRSLAFSVSDAAASLLYYANRLVELPVGVFAIAISTVVFPSLAASIARGKADEFAKTYRNGILLCLLLAFPSAVGLSILAPEIIAVLFERGLFSDEDTRATIPLVIIFCIGMPFYSFISVETRAFYAMKDTRTPVRVAIIAFVVNVILSLLLMKPYGAAGLALANNIAAVVQAIMLHFSLRSKNYDTKLRLIAGDMVKILAASVVMGVAVRFTSGWLASQLEEGTLGLSLRLVTSIVAGVGLYFAMLLALRVRFKALFQ